MAVELAGEHRAGLIGVSADGDDGGHLAIEKIVHVFRCVVRNIDADLAHDLDGLGMDIARGLRSRACDFHEIARRRAEDAFGEMAPAGVACAEDEDERFLGSAHAQQDSEEQPDVPETCGVQSSFARQSVCFEPR